MLSRVLCHIFENGVKITEPEFIKDFVKVNKLELKLDADGRNYLQRCQIVLPLDINIV